VTSSGTFTQATGAEQGIAKTGQSKHAVLYPQFRSRLPPDVEGGMSTRYAAGRLSAYPRRIGGIIGPGIFSTPAIVPPEGYGDAHAWPDRRRHGRVARAIFGELAARIPRVGGGYAYLQGFARCRLSTGGRFPHDATGAIAASRSPSQAMPVRFWFASGSASCRGGAIAVLTALNYSVRPAAWTQNVLTVPKLAALAILIFAAPSAGSGAAGRRAAPSSRASA
jgi:hypothetical protein